MYKMFDILQGEKHKNPLSEKDIISALEAYDKEYYNFKIEDIEHLTDIRIERNKRNGRKQNVHLKIARMTRDILHENWREGNGRPSKEQLVKDYIKDNLTAKPMQIAKALNISRTTVYKYMK